jgi:serine/threonine protein kinase/WD40 repeat protein
MRQESIFAEALRISDANERAAYLKRSCGGNAELRRQVEALLAAHVESNVLDRPAIELARTTPDLSASSEEQPGTVVGPYKLLQHLGEGGFGVVFLAEQQEPVRRKVALKVIKPGMDSKQVLARFEQERQALALMDHPGIARIFDAGTTQSGRPYFVMELVKGIPLTRFCDDNRLGTRERLELFAQVCAAIQHAHTKGIIHRDIKPSNVLVALYDGKPVPKVIDFGVAKAIEQSLTEQTLFTRVGQVIGTFEYMSPEQATMNQLDVDTRSDVYALGVLLYELLTGFTPLDKERLHRLALDEMLRAIREEEPQRPSARLSDSGSGLPLAAGYRGTDGKKLTDSLRGELDWIALKALEKDRSRRYQSAMGLAEDVGRYLRDEQVHACPPSWGYRLGKTLRKHRAAITLAGTAAALLLVGAVVSGCLAWWALSERQLKSDALVRAQDDRAEADRRRIAAEEAQAKEKAARLDTRRASYAQSMALIRLAWESGDVRYAARLLDGLHPRPGDEDLRGFEYYYWDRQIHQERRSTLLVAKEGIAFRANERLRLVALSGDGARAAYFCFPRQDGDPLLKVVDAASGEERFSLRAEPGRRDGASLTLNRDGTRVAFLLPAPGHGFSRKLDPRWGIRSSMRVEVWDVQGKGDRPLFARAAQKAGFLRVLAFSPDGNRLATAEALETTRWGQDLSSVLVQVWDLDRPAEPIFQTDAEFKRHDGNVAWAFSPDGSRLAMVASGALQVWNLATGNRLVCLLVKGDVDAIAYHPDGKRLAGIGLGRRIGKVEGSPLPEVNLGPVQIHIWEGADSDALKEARATTIDSPVPWAPDPRLRRRYRLAFSPDGRLLAVWHGGTRIHLLSTDTGAQTHLLRPIGLPDLAAFSKDGGRLRAVVGGDDEVDIGWAWKEWDLAAPDQDTTRPRQAVPPSVTAHSRNGERQVTFEHRLGARAREGPRITIRDRAGKELRSFGELHEGLVRGAAFSPNGRLVASVGLRSGCKIWEADTGKVVRSFPARPPSGTVTSLRLWLTNNQPLPISRDGQLLVVSDEGGVKVIGFDDQKERFGVAQATEAYFGHDGRRLVTVHRSTGAEGKGSPDRLITFKVWDVESGRELPSHSGQGANLAFSADGRWFLVIPEGPSDLALVEVSAAGRRHVLRGVSDPRECEYVVFSPDGSRLITSPAPDTQDRPNRVWNAKSGQELFRLSFPPTTIFPPPRALVTFSPDGRRIAAPVPVRLDSGKARNEVRVWDADTGHELLKLPMPPRSTNFLIRAVSNRHLKLSFTPDGHRLAVECDLLPENVRRAILGPIAIRTWNATPREERKR